MTNAERQKRYRDRKRGGPAVGRWAGCLSVAKLARSQRIGRTMVFMAKWVVTHAPDVAPQLDAGILKMTPTYRRLRDQYVMGVALALEKKPARGNHRLVESRKGGRFVFKWVPSST